MNFTFAHGKANQALNFLKAGLLSFRNVAANLAARSSTTASARE